MKLLKGTSLMNPAYIQSNGTPELQILNSYLPGAHHLGLCDNDRKGICVNFGRKSFFDSESTGISPFWRGHLFLFDRPLAPTYSSREGLKLLLVFLFLEGMARPLLGVGARWLSIAGRNWWPLTQTSLLTALACWLLVGFAGVHLSELGLYSWMRWSKTEKLYFLQILPIAIAVFSIFTFGDLKGLWARPHLWAIGSYIFVPKMIWGFYQELVYRGMLQTELVRRWGAWRGIFLSNLIFTFGPLHFYHFKWLRTNPSHLWIFVAIFAIGLFFAIIFWRSGNLGMIGTLHGLGDWFIDGLAEVSRLAG
jgi:membrane protease YdiL (CAAX protease family)